MVMKKEAKKGTCVPTSVMDKNLCLKSKRSQVTIFIIIAIILVFVVVIFFFYRGSIFKDKVPATIGPVYSSFLDCVEEDALLGADILGTQGGHIYVN